MTDEEVRQQVERTDRFIAEFRELITSVALDPTYPIKSPAIRGLHALQIRWARSITSPSATWPMSMKPCVATC